MRKVKVSLGERSYPILIGDGLLPELGEHCRKLQLKPGTACAIISDRNVAPRFQPQVEESLRKAGFRTVTLTIPAGEKSKDLKRVEWCYNQLAAARFDRHSLIIALGGGVVGDLAGFVAATYLRGIACVQAPTTLLAQVDSAIGGKVGVNLRAGKNLVGAFLQPGLVLADLETLQTLPDRQLRSGLAEVIKYGMIYDAALLASLERDLARILGLEMPVLERVIARCCAIKAEIVAQDETETGLRAILNFGHTIGHALEALTGYGKLLHGEAIAIGQVLAARLSEEQLGFPRSDSERLIALLKNAGLPVEVSLSDQQRRQMLEIMQLDKKNQGGELKFVLARRIGEVEYGCSVPLEMVKKVLKEGIKEGVRD